MTIFGTDPLSDSPDLVQQREINMEQIAATPDEIFAHVVNGDYSLFSQALQCLITSTDNLRRQL